MFRRIHWANMIRSEKQWLYTGFVGHGAFPPAFAPPPFGFQDPARGRGHFAGGNGGGGGGGSAYVPRFQPGGGRRRPPPPLHERDRPKSKHALVGCEPWLLVRTRFGRRFVHDPAKGESFWRVPDFLREKVAELEAQLEQQKKEKEKEKGQTKVAAEAGSPAIGGQQPSPAGGAGAGAGAASLQRPGHASARNDGEQGVEQRGREEEEEDEDDEEAGGVDSTDDEGYEDDDDADTPHKRPRLDSGQAGGGDTVVREFGEDDIAYQLAAMGEQYGLDPGEYGLAPAEDADDGGEAWPDGAAGLPLTDEECTGLFKEMLDEHTLNPYATWDKIVAEGRLVDDARYTALPNMKARREVWAEWSREKIRELKEQRAKTEAKNVCVLCFIVPPFQLFFSAYYLFNYGELRSFAVSPFLLSPLLSNAFFCLYPGPTAKWSP